MSEELRIVQPSLPLSDPHICSDSKARLSLLAAIYEPLVKRIAPGIFEPLLAETWTVDHSAKIWEFKLRDNVRSHDNSRLEAIDVVSTLKRVIDPSIGGTFGTEGVYASYIGTARFEELSRLKLRITTREPMADLLELLVEMPMVSEEVLYELPDTYLGTGPYIINDFDGDTVEMHRNPLYWGARSHYKKLSWVAIPDQSERIGVVWRAEADIASYIDYRGNALAKGLGVKLAEHADNLCIIYLLNCAKGPCVDSQVRKALNYATDKVEIVAKLLNGFGEELCGPLTPLHFGYDPDMKPYPHDVEKARSLLADAGRTDLTLKMDVPKSMPDEAPELSKLLKEQWEKAGVDVDITVHNDREAYSRNVRNKRIGDLCCFDSSPMSAFRILREKISSKVRGPWWEGYSNSNVDALIWQSQRTVDSQERARSYRAVCRIIRDDPPWLFLYRPINYWAIGQKVSSWSPSFDGVLRF